MARIRRSIRPWRAFRRDLFGICVAGANGDVFAIGDSDFEFSIMSVSKPFVFALVCEALGADVVREKIGVNATGLAFNSLGGHRTRRRRQDQPDGELRRDRDDEPGAGRHDDAKWKFIHEGLSRFAGRTLALNDEVYASASETNSRNQSIARLLQSFVASTWSRRRRRISTPSSAL